MSRIAALLARETALAWGRGGGPLVTLGFYAGVTTLLPLAVGPEAERLAAVAAGVPACAAAAWTSRPAGSAEAARASPACCSTRRRVRPAEACEREWL